MLRHEMFDAALLWGTRGGAGPEGCDCISTALLAPAMLSDTASCSSGSTQLLCGVGGTLHIPVPSVLAIHRLPLQSMLTMQYGAMLRKMHHRLHALC